MYDPHHSLCRGGVKRRFANLGDLCGYLHFSGFIIQVLDMSGFTHFDEAGQAHMVGVAEKSETRRIARAAGKITMQPATLSLILEGGSKKGDVIGVARIAAIQASKRASELIPLCHPLALTKVGVEFNVDKPNAAIECIVTAETLGRTGVEMEALTAVSVGLLTIYDMCKAVDRGMQVDGIRLLEKQGGKSGHWVAAV